MDLNFSKEQFIEWTTEGYPLRLSSNLTIEVLFDSLAEFVNLNENKFTAEVYQDTVNIYEEQENIIMTVVYKNNRVVMLTDINDQNVDEQSFAILTRQKILGQACVGVITFCQTLSSFFMTDDLIKEKATQSKKFNNTNVQVAWMLSN
jgi:hypothetical protein